MSSMHVTCVATRRSDIKKIILRYRDIVYFVLSLFMGLMIFINSLIFNSVFIGIFTSITYILINGNFLGCTFFKESDLKLPLGVLLLIAFLGLLGWLFIVFAGLTIIEVTIVLYIASVFSFGVKKYTGIRAMIAKKKQ